MLEAGCYADHGQSYGEWVGCEVGRVERDIHKSAVVDYAVDLLEVVCFWGVGSVVECIA